MVPADPADYIAPENKARIRIDQMLERAGWVVQDYKNVNLYAGEGVAVRELITNAGRVAGPPHRQRAPPVRVRVDRRRDVVHLSVRPRADRPAVYYRQPPSTWRHHR